MTVVGSRRILKAWLCLCLLHLIYSLKHFKMKEVHDPMNLWLRFAFVYTIKLTLTALLLSVSPSLLCGSVWKAIVESVSRVWFIYSQLNSGPFAYLLTVSHVASLHFTAMMIDVCSFILHTVTVNWRFAVVALSCQCGQCLNMRWLSLRKISTPGN